MISCKNFSHILYTTHSFANCSIFLATSAITSLFAKRNFLLYWCGRVCAVVSNGACHHSISRKISEKCAAICEIPEIIRGNANEERFSHISVIGTEKLGEIHTETGKHRHMWCWCCSWFIFRCGGTTKRICWMKWNGRFLFYSQM